MDRCDGCGHWLWDSRVGDSTPDAAFLSRGQSALTRTGRYRPWVGYCQAHRPGPRWVSAHRESAQPGHNRAAPAPSHRSRLREYTPIIWHSQLTPLLQCGRRRQASEGAGMELVVFLIIVALIFDFINGFHDAANSIATVVSTRVLSPFQAVIWAAFFNFVAAFGFGVQVATTVGKGVIDPAVVDAHVIFGGLMGAIVWDLITWVYGLPTSSSHALIGGYAGAAVAKAGFAAIIPGGWTTTIIFIFLSPLIGLGVGLAVMTSIYWIFRWTPPSRVDRWFRRLQLVSAAF